MGRFGTTGTDAPGPMQCQRKQCFEAPLGPLSAIGSFRVASENALGPSDAICNSFQRYT